jgi:hypothetical protein
VLKENAMKQHVTAAGLSWLPVVVDGRLRGHDEKEGDEMSTANLMGNVAGLTAILAFVAGCFSHDLQDAAKGGFVVYVVMLVISGMIGSNMVAPTTDFSAALGQL